jgi:hypothetical protein
MCDFTEGEISSIAQHEHISDMAAILMAQGLIQCRDGALVIQHMILDDILQAQAARNSKQAERWRNVLEHFIATHPQDRMFVNSNVAQQVGS